MLYKYKPRTTLAVAGSDFAVAIADDRVSKGYSICTRKGCKITKLYVFFVSESSFYLRTDQCVILTSGMLADQITLHKVLLTKIKLYEADMHKSPSIEAIAQMLSTTLYYKRFFPYYTFNLLAGVDSNGKGAVYGYDAIGSYERLSQGAQGSGRSLVQSILDNQVSKTNQLIPTGAAVTVDDLKTLCKDAISSACERDIYTGDSATICVISSEGVRFEKMELRKD
jgi:20S proteasome subunit beta 6